MKQLLNIHTNTIQNFRGVVPAMKRKYSLSGGLTVKKKTVERLMKDIQFLMTSKQRSPAIYRRDKSLLVQRTARANVGREVAH